MSPNFKHINADQQIINGTVTTPLLADGSVTIQKININGDLTFNEHQALALRLENVSSTPSPGNAGRLIWNTTLGEVLVDTGTIFESISSIGTVSSIHADSFPNLTGNIQFASGANITLGQVGNTITINAGASNINYQQDLFIVSNPVDHVFTLSQTPITNSQLVLWNGLGLARGVSEDYTLSGLVVTLNAGIELTIGDKILIIYAY